MDIEGFDIKEPYFSLFGFIPEKTAVRHAFTSKVMPEILNLQEYFRKCNMHSLYLDEKFSQMMLFGMLSSHMRDGARVHAISSRKLGATWEELHAVSNLVFLFFGLPAFNFSIRILADLYNDEMQSEGEGGN